MTVIDISYWQHSPDFSAVKASGVSRVIMKCGGGEGGNLYQDSVYAGNRGAARAQGLAVGSYFFNGPVDPTAAADYQFNIIDWRDGDIVAIDVESNGNQQPWNPGQVFAWCSRILAHGVPAHQVLGYMSSSLLGAGWDAVVGLGVGLWVAQYGPNDGTAHSTPSSGPWPAWSLWQYTSAATCPGVVGNVDTNMLNPSMAGLFSTLIQEDDMTPDQDARLKNIETILGGLQTSVRAPSVGVEARAATLDDRTLKMDGELTTIQNTLIDPTNGVLAAIARGGVVITTAQLTAITTAAQTGAEDGVKALSFVTVAH